MSPQWAEGLYVAVLRLCTPLALLRLWWRGRLESLYRHAWWERLGWYQEAGAPPAQQTAEGGPCLCLHAVSLGETRAAESLIRELRRLRPDLRLVLTHSTATGRLAGQGLVHAGDHQVWLPYDTPGAVRRFLSRFAPTAIVLMETEVWPILVREAQRQRCPVVLANARLSEKSLYQGLKFAALLGTAATRLSLVLAQTRADAQRIMTMGAPCVEVSGNLKFDMTPQPSVLALGRAWKVVTASSMPAVRPLVLAASTREGEEDSLLSFWAAQLREIPASAPRPRLCIVPRHPQRFEAVAQRIHARGWTCSRRSQWIANQPGPEDCAADVWLGDTVNEMPAYYAAADVALLGGSFAPHGGQNLIEAAACACPLVIGPSVYNFAHAAELSLQVGAAVQVTNLQEAVVMVRVLLASADRLRDMSQAALKFATDSRGSATRQAQAILACLPPESARPSTRTASSS